MLERHRATLARGIDALRLSGDRLPRGLLGNAAGVPLCVRADDRHILPLLFRPIS